MIATRNVAADALGLGHSKREPLASGSLATCFRKCLACSSKTGKSTNSRAHHWAFSLSKRLELPRFKKDGRDTRRAIPERASIVEQRGPTFHHDSVTTHPL